MCSHWEKTFCLCKSLNDWQKRIYENLKPWQRPENLLQHSQELKDLCIKRKLFLGSRAPLAAAVTAPRAMVSANHASGVKMEIASSRQTFKHSLYLRWKVDQRDFVTFSWFQWTLCSCHWGLRSDFGKDQDAPTEFSQVELKSTKEWRCRIESLPRIAWTLVVGLSAVIIGD